MRVERPWIWILEPSAWSEPVQNTWPANESYFAVLNILFYSSAMLPMCLILSFILMDGGVINITYVADKITILVEEMSMRTLQLYLGNYQNLEML
jgi:hypothetical protein